MGLQLSKKNRIAIMIVLDTIFCIIELTGAVWLQSLALMADAFHMLNDIISLAIGYYAVSMSEQSSSEKFTYGYLRAEILGAFFNAVFLIALCVSIMLEAINRFVDLPKIQNPKVIVIVGVLGLLSNGLGFLVLGGHDHDHGHAHGDEDDDHDHSGHIHDHLHDHAHDARSHEDEQQDYSLANPIDYDIRSAEEGWARHHQRFNNVDGISMYPSSFRQEILETTRKMKAGHDHEHDYEEEPTETTGLLAGGYGNSHGTAPDGHSHTHEHNEQDEHHGHNHTLPRPAATSYSHSHSDMGMNAMILHVLGDALGNVGVIATGLIIHYWNSQWAALADPITSLLISFIILYTAVPLTLATAKVLLQATPDHLDISLIKEDIEALPGVKSCHHVHIWQLSDTKIVASMHIRMSYPEVASNTSRYMELARSARKCLHAYGIHSATIQPEYCQDEENERALEEEALRRQTEVGSEVPGEICLLECVEDCAGRGCCLMGSIGGSVHSGESHEHE